MYPYIHFYKFSFPTYGIMMLLGMAASVGIVVIRSTRFGYSHNDALLTALIAFAVGIIGAMMIRPVTKLPDVIINWEQYSKVPVGEFLSWFIGELVFYGGLTGGAVAVVLYCNYFKMSLTRIADMFAPALPVGHAFGRIGCLLAGCCYGIEVSHSNPLSIIYPERMDGLGALAAPAGIPVLAVPAIEAAVNIIIACLILLLQHFNKLVGRGIAVYGMLYSIARFSLEFFRGDILRGVYKGGSTSQIISIIIFAVSILWFVLVPRKTNLAAGL